MKVLFLVVAITWLNNVFGQKTLFTMSNEISANKDSLIFYTGSDNLLIVSYDSRKIGRIHLKSDNADLVNLKEYYQYDTLKVAIDARQIGSGYFWLIGSKEKKINKYFYTTKYTPDCKAGLNRSNDSVISIEQIKSAKGLITYFDDTNLLARGYITRFNFEAINNGVYFNLHVVGNYFPKDLLALIKNLRRKTIIKFTNIVCSSPFGSHCSVTLQDRTYYVK